MDSVLVSQVMSTSVVTLPMDADMQHARAEMLDTPGSALPVVDSSRHPIGIVTKTDLIQPVSDDVPVAVIMSQPVITCGPEDRVVAVAQQMRQNVVHHVVVVEEGRVVAMVSVFDLLELFGH